MPAVRRDARDDQDIPQTLERVRQPGHTVGAHPGATGLAGKARCPKTHTRTRQASRHQYRRRVGDRPPQPASESRHWSDHPIDCTPLAMPDGCKGRLPRRICLHANASVSTSWEKTSQASDVKPQPRRKHCVAPVAALHLPVPETQHSAFWHTACISSADTAAAAPLRSERRTWNNDRDRHLMTLATHPHSSRIRPASGGSRSSRHFA